MPRFESDFGRNHPELRLELPIVVGGQPISSLHKTAEHFELVPRSLATSLMHVGVDSLNFKQAQSLVLAGNGIKKIEPVHFMQERFEPDPDSSEWVPFKRPPLDMEFSIKPEFKELIYDTCVKNNISINELIGRFLNMGIYLLTDNERTNRGIFKQTMVGGRPIFSPYKIHMVSPLQYVKVNEIYYPYGRR